MVRFAKSLYALAVVVCATGVAGCGPNGLHHCQTTLLVDGSIDRAVLVPQAHVPEDAKQAARWDQLRLFKSASFDDFDDDIRVLERRKHSPDPSRQKEPFLAAWKHCSSIDDVPDHFVMVGGEPSAISRFRRQQKQVEYGLLTEHVWLEELTEVVRLEDVVVARRELFALLIERANAILKGGLDEGYDATLLLAWLKDEGAVWFEEICATHFDAMSRNDGSRQDELWDREVLKRMADVCRRHGLEIQIEDDEEAKEHNERAFHDFLRQLAKRTILPPPGREIDDQLIDALPTLLVGDFDDNVPAEKRFAAAEKQFVDSYPGGEDAFKARLRSLATRIWGIHGGLFGLLASRERFRFDVTVPGIVVETNGVLRSENRVRWEFSASDAFPLGYTMRVRWLQRSTADIAGVAPDALAGRDAMLKLLDHMGGDEQIREVLVKCREQRSLIPLEDALANAAQPEASLRRLAALKQLLAD